MTHMGIVQKYILLSLSKCLFRELKRSIFAIGPYEVAIRKTQVARERAVSVSGTGTGTGIVKFRLTGCQNMEKRPIYSHILSNFWCFFSFMKCWNMLATNLKTLNN